MKLATPFRIALRYLVAPKRHNVVNVIAFIAIAGVAVATIAMVVVLSVFNGFSDLAEAHITYYDPPLRIERADGRIIANADSLRDVVAAQSAVSVAEVTITERGLTVTRSAQCAVIFRAVPDNYCSIAAIDSLIIDGVYSPQTTDGRPAAQLSVGVANSLLMRPGAESMLNVYVPRRQGRINPANPSAAFRTSELAVSGVYQVQQPDIDTDQMLIPLSEAREMLDYTTEGSAIELAVADEASVDDVQKALQTSLGAEYKVLNRLQQRSEAFKMISIEKWVTFMMMVFVLVIALFNILATLSLLIIEKRDNMRTLRAMGATGAMVRMVFTLEAWIITLVGGAIGAVIGVLLSLLQQYGQIIKLNGDAQVLAVTAYPVRVSLVDLGVVLIVVALTGLISAVAVRVLTRKM